MSVFAPWMAIAVLALTAAPAEAAKKPARPDLQTSLAVPAPAVASPGGAIVAGATVRNAGTKRARPSELAYFASVNATRGRDDVRLAGAPIPAIGPRRSTKSRTSLSLPSNLPLGRLFLLACADAGRRVAESREGNNCSRLVAIQLARPPAPPLPAPVPALAGPAPAAQQQQPAAASGSSSNSGSGSGSTPAPAPDTTAPTIANVTSSDADGTYGPGSAISVVVQLTENVTVTGAPQLLLETGATDRAATYADGSGTNALRFVYTPVAGDTTPDLDYVSVAALALNGGTIKDAAGNNAVVVLPVPGTPTSLAGSKAIVVDGIAPTVAHVTANKTNGTYGPGATVPVEVVFNENVVVTGTPQITLETGASDAVVNYTSGSGTSTLVFTYTIGAGHTSSDLDYASTSALALNGGTIRDVATNDAVLTLATPGTANSLAGAKDINLDTAGPTVTNVTANKTNGTWGAGATIPVQVVFSEPVVVTGTPQITLETGASDAAVNYTSGSGTNTLVFTYTVSAPHTSSDLDYVSSSALALNEGTIRDAATNAAVLTLPAPGAASSLGANKALVLDTTGPTVTGVSGNAGAYNAGDQVLLTVSFNDPIVVTGTPRLTLETGTTDRTANFVAVTGGSTLLLEYIVVAGDNAADLDYVSTSALGLNGGTIRDAAGNDAVLTLPTPGGTGSLAANRDIVIDTTAPFVTNVTATTPDGTYASSSAQIIDIHLSYSETILWGAGGTPTLTLETGTTDRAASLVGVTSATNALFRYTTVAGDNTPDLDYVSSTALNFNGANVRDQAGNPADPTLPAPGATGSLGANKAIVITP